jgi:hypothetical protein
MVVLLVLAFVWAACDRQDAKKPWEQNSYGHGNPPAAKAIVFVGVDRDFGDIPIRYSLAPADGKPRTVKLEYSGACGGDAWRSALFDGEHTALAAGAYTVTWWSWDQEAGCAGEVRFRLTTDRGESAESAPIQLDNTRPDATGFIEYPQYDQGVNENEEAALAMALPALMGDDTVDFVALRREDEYEVHAARGSVSFHREQTREGRQYVVDDVVGENPIERQDPSWISTYEEELAAGDNPNNINLRRDGYPRGDPRLSFIQPENDSYPFAYERIAAYFDHPDSADLMINWKSYAHGDVDLGEHGSLNVTQSRSPLILWGRGIAPGELDEFIRQVDVAPTVAKLLGFPTTFGVDERGIWSHQVYLTQQDGHPIESALNGATAEHVIVLVLDGLAHTELLHELEAHADLLPNFARLAQEGAVARYGSITNWPSVTYPSHNVIGSGVYSGHHGLVDNQYFLRDEAKRADPIDQLLLTEGFFNPNGPAETLHMAVHRVFGDYNRHGQSGAVTASLMDPSVAGADKADLEFRDRTRQVPFPPLGLKFPPGIPYPVALALPWDIYFAQYTELAALWQFYYLYENGVSPSPTYLIMNFSTTDSAGHAIGPHGDDMLTVLEHIDLDLGAVFDWLELWGLTEKTALILTSDHGMQLGDPSRSGWPIDSLEAAGVRREADTWLGVYFAIADVRFDLDALAPNEYQLFQVSVTDIDTGIPAAEVELTATDGVTELSARTDERGIAEFGIAPVDTVWVTVEAGKLTRQSFPLPLREGGEQ